MVGQRHIDLYLYVVRTLRGKAGQVIQIQSTSDPPQGRPHTGLVRIRGKKSRTQDNHVVAVSPRPPDPAAQFGA